MIVREYPLLGDHPLSLMRLKSNRVDSNKIQNLDLLYKAGIISQYQYAWEMGYDSPSEEEPRVSLEDQFAKGGNSDPQEGSNKKRNRRPGR